MWIETTKRELVNLEHVETIMIKSADDNTFMRLEANTTSGAQIILVSASEIRNTIKDHLLEELAMHDILENVFDTLTNMINRNDMKVVKINLCWGNICDLHKKTHLVE